MAREGDADARADIGEGKGEDCLAGESRGSSLGELGIVTECGDRGCWEGGTGARGGLRMFCSTLMSRRRCAPVAPSVCWALPSTYLSGLSARGWGDAGDEADFFGLLSALLLSIVVVFERYSA